MNSGQPPTPRKIQVNPSTEIKANSSTDKLRPTLQLKIKTNSSTEN